MTDWRITWSIDWPIPRSVPSEIIATSSASRTRVPIGDAVMAGVYVRSVRRRGRRAEARLERQQAGIVGRMPERRTRDLQRVGGASLAVQELRQRAPVPGHLGV